MRHDIYRRASVSLVLVLALQLFVPVQAIHIIGGDLSMRAVGTTPGLFRLQLNQYWDAAQTNSGNTDLSVRLLIYRKQNPILIESVTLTLQETLPLTFDNQACAKLRQLSFSQGQYYGTHQFNPSRYTDPGGYYIVWERCCRNDALTNINAAAGAGVAMTFYLEFPPMIKNGVAFKNSAPDFRLPNGSYICLNKPFTFSADATDADGDQLRYSLVTPLNGYTDRNNPNSITDTPRTSYPPITWAAGYSLTNSIPGNPPLTINASTGQLSVRASQEGLFLFAVQCEEFRNGERIGVVRRDIQLPVVDCSKNTPPPATVLANGKVVSELSWCQSQPLTLTVEKNPAWAYQWQKDGSNLRGSTADTLGVKESGTYTVVKSQANTCANDTTSQAIKVTLVTTSPVNLSIVSPRPYCAGDTITIRADGTTATQYRWRQGGVDIPGEQRSILRVYQSGQYSVSTSSAVCNGQDSINVTINARPTVQVKASSLAFCPDTPAQLTASSNQNNVHYAWQRNNTILSDTISQVSVKQAGVYQVTVTAPTGCTASSEQLTLTPYESPLVQIDSIAPICEVSNPVSLKAQPAGGTFAGDGVKNNLFDPAAAGIGRHKLTYTIVSDKGCRTEQSRWIDVSGGPTLTGQTRYDLIKGNSVQLVTQTNESISRYRWEPPESLSQADVASPVATPIVTTTYQLTALNGIGCASTFSVEVAMTEPLYIPSAFSPNADGVNDAWIIPNISAFPKCEVSIFNRWGELIFYSQGYAQPWDGTYRQTSAQVGIYTYQINTGAGLVPATYWGQLTITR